MVKLIFILIAVFVCYQLIRQKGHMKIVWLFGGLLFFPHSIGILNEPVVISFHRLFIYTLLLTVFFTKKTIFRDLRQMPFVKHLGVVFVCLLIIGFADERLNMFLKFYRPVTYFIESFLVMFLAYIYIGKIEDSSAFYRKFMAFLIVFCVYGISNYITRTNEYYALLATYFDTSDFANANMSEFVQRFRVSSFAFHAILYGLILSLGVFVFFYLQYSQDNRRLKWVKYLGLPLILVNLLLVNSRTPFISLAAGFLIFFLFAMKAPAKLQAIVMCVIIFVVSGMYFSDFRDTMVASLDIFTNKDSEILGSSLDMRKEQLYASIDLFKRNPIVGNGVQFINEELGYSSDRSKNFAPQELRGFESYVFKLLIEQGALGILANLYLFGSILFYFLNKSRNRPAVLGLAILCSFLLFIVGTGDLNSFPFVMVLLGVTIKTVQLTSASRLRRNEAPQNLNAPAGIKSK